MERPTADGLRKALDRVERAPADRFVIIERGEQHYMQCLVRRDWRLEKREGDEDHHFDGRRLEEEASAERLALLKQIDEREELFCSRLDREDVEAAMLSYLANEPEPEWLIWTAVVV